MRFTQERYEVFARLGREIDDRADRAVSLYVRLVKESGVDFRSLELPSNGRVYLDDLHGGLSTDWENTWSYGGYERGSSEIPVEWLLDDTWEEAVFEAANKKIRGKRSEVRSEARARKTAERAELKRLQQKLERGEI